jgi:Leucine-rich repeat (LRR) protein
MMKQQPSSYHAIEKKGKITIRDNQASTSTMGADMRIKHDSGMKFLKSRKSKEDSVHIQREHNETFDCEIITPNLAIDESLQNDLPVGAFHIRTNILGMDDVEERSLFDKRLLRTESTQEQTLMDITIPETVNGNYPNIVNAVPVKEWKTKSLMRYRIFFIILFLLLATIVIIILFVLLRRRSSIESSPDLPTFAPTLDMEVKDLLENLKPLLSTTSRQQLEIPDSVPSSAFNWLVKSNFNSYSFDQQVQRFAMASFYFSTKGTLWKKKNGWLTDDDECTWYQDYKPNPCVNGTLQVLSLYDNNLHGLLSNDIALLSSLNMLNLSTNNLEGPIPIEIRNLSSLVIVDLSGNRLNGMIPTEIGVLKNLRELYLNNNWISGEIPSELFECTELTTLVLLENNLDGSIPKEIGQCVQLMKVDFKDNDLVGSIPSEVGQLTRLTKLDLERNDLDGTIPSEVGQCTQLMNLDLEDNNLDGSIPIEIGQCIQLTEMDLNNNTLVGSIPSEIGQCIQLWSLILSYNSFDGTIPSEIGLCKNLTNLDFTDNNLHGSLPYEIYEIPSIKELYFLCNNVTFSVP